MKHGSPKPLFRVLLQCASLVGSRATSLYDTPFVKISDVVRFAHLLHGHGLVSSRSLCALSNYFSQQQFNCGSKVDFYGERALSNRRFSLCIPEDLAEWLEKEAARQDRTRNNLINRILEQYRKKP